jgi:ABC-type transport system involved in multi-copper enzyme maturation permease subunit
MNPVLRKDMIGLLRLKRVGAIHVLFAAVLALLVLATWPQQRVVSLASRGQDALLLGLILGQLVLLVLFVPCIAAVSITSEREQGTLEMLYASRLTALQVVLGKLMSAIGYPLMLLIGGLPFMALLNFRGDVEVAAMLWAYMLLAVSAVLLAMLSLAISALCRQSATALVISYIAVLAICGGVLVPAAIMLGSQSGWSAQVLHYVRGVSPVAATLSLLRPRLWELGGRPEGMDQTTGQAIAAQLPAWQVFVPAAAVMILACVIILVLVLRKPPSSTERLGGARAAPGDADHFHRSLSRRIIFLIDPKKQRRPIGNLNPILVKEARTNKLRSGGWMIRIFYGSLFVSMALALMAVYGGQTEHGDLLRYVAGVLVALQIGIIALIDPSLTSPTISSEVEEATFETLRLTPLRSRQIFWGKFVPALAPALLPIVALLPAYAAVCFVDEIYLRATVRVLPVFVLTVALCCASGLACSTFAASTARATIANYLIITSLIVLPMLVWLAAGTHVEGRVARWLALPSPLVICLSLLPGGSRDVARIWPQHLVLVAGLCLLMLLAARVRLGVLLRRG